MYQALFCIRMKNMYRVRSRESSLPWAHIPDSHVTWMGQGGGWRDVTVVSVSDNSHGWRRLQEERGSEAPAVALCSGASNGRRRCLQFVRVCSVPCFSLCCVRNLYDDNKNESYQLPGKIIWYLRYYTIWWRKIMLLLYLLYDNSWQKWQWRGSRCTRLICTSGGTVPGKCPNHIIIDEAAKPTKLPNNATAVNPVSRLLRVFAEVEGVSIQGDTKDVCYLSVIPFIFKNWLFCYAVQAHAVKKQKPAVHTYHTINTCTRDWSFFILRPLLLLKMAKANIRACNYWCLYQKWKG